MRYCFDLDGTLCDTPGTDYEHARPRWDRIDRVKELLADGHEVTIQTARGEGEPRDGIKPLTMGQVWEWGLGACTVVFGKVPADLYVDDKGVSDEAFFG